MQTKTPTKPLNFTQRLKEIDLFFEGRGKEHKTLQRVVEKLEKAKISYAIVGGMAVNIHGMIRTTKDVDLLLTQPGFEEFCRRFVPKSYDPVPGRPRRFYDRRFEVHIDILITGLFPGSGAPGPVAYPDPANVGQPVEHGCVIDLPALIQLKLAARRHYDWGDVVNLIRVHNLDEGFQAKLHPSLHRDYIECLEEKRREDEYERRQDAAVEALLKKQPQAAAEEEE